MLTETGAVALHTAESIKATKRESFRFFAGVNGGEMYLELEPDRVVAVRINGVVRTTGWGVDGRTLTLTGVHADRTLVQIEYEATKLHRRGEQRYVFDVVKDEWVAAEYSSAPTAEFKAGTLKVALGNEAQLYYGGEISKYFATDVKPALPNGTLRHRVTVVSANADADFLYSGLEHVSVSTGAGADDVLVETTHAGTTTVATGGGIDRVAVREINGLTTLLTGDQDDTVHVGTKSGFWPDGFTNFNGHANGIHTRLADRRRRRLRHRRRRRPHRHRQRHRRAHAQPADGVFDTGGDAGYVELERLDIHLGDATAGNTLLIESTHGVRHEGRVSRTSTRPRGDDVINVETIVRPDDDPTGTGDDLVRVGSDTARDRPAGGQHARPDPQRLAGARRRGRRRPRCARTTAADADTHATTARCAPTA